MEELHIDTTITNNAPPPYSGVSEVQLTNYINRLYIDLLGRAPTQNEIENSVEYLESRALSDQAKDTLIQELMNTEDYYHVFFTLTSADFINAADSAAIVYEIEVIKFVHYVDSLNGNTQNFIYYQYELNRLYRLQNITVSFRNGSASLNEYFAAFLDNYFYDQVNMGTENFVKGSFSDLFRRSPTQSELITAVTMVDNNPAILFTQDGDSKGDFITIVTTNHEFYEGLVIKAYSQLLLREAISQELTEGTATLQESKDYPAFQKQLMKTDEYAGF
ncbi:MAG: hypothetical protein ABIO98_04700 [Chitinophagales bacterium]